MRILESTTAAILLILALPVFMTGWFGTMLVGERPILRRRVVRLEGEDREILEFNLGHGGLGLAFRRGAITPLPTLFWVLTGRISLSDFIRWREHR